MPSTATTWQWIDPGGAASTLWVEYDVRAIAAPPVVHAEDGVPGQPGARWRETRHGPREFVLPLYLRHDSPVTLRQQIRALIAAMDPTRGEGRIRVTTLAGDQREIACRYTSGLELEETRGARAWPTHQRAAVTFRAFDPYWLDISDTVIQATAGAPVSWFPIFPLRLSTSEVWSDATITLTGDVESWPVWRVTGPGSSIALRNLTTAETLSLSTVLTAGQQLTIDTRPGAKTVTLDDGTNRFGDLSATSALWSLRRGVNAVRMEMGGTTAASALRCSYRNRYLAA